MTTQTFHVCITNPDGSTARDIAFFLSKLSAMRFAREVDLEPRQSLCVYGENDQLIYERYEGAVLA